MKIKKTYHREKERQCPVCLGDGMVIDRHTRELRWCRVCVGKGKVVLTESYC